MRVLFLIFAFIPFVLTVQAKRSFSDYTCQVSHKHSERAFHLSDRGHKTIDVGGWNIIARLNRVENEMEVSLARIVNIMDATYEKVAKRRYPLRSRTLPLQLEHSFGGKTDVFNMTCYPRDP